MVPSTLDKIKTEFAAGNIREAIRLAATFKHLGTQRDAIQRGWSAMQNPGFYRDIGVDVNDAIAEASAAIAERFEL